MNIDRTVKSISDVLEKYNQFLSGLDEEEFQRCPSEGAWSYSEVYSHVLYVNKASLMAIERCIHGKSSSGRLSWKAWLVFFSGRLPPWKMKAPEKVAAMVIKISPEEARNELIKIREKLFDLLPEIKKASRKPKVYHAILGMLNARQWLRFIEIHSIHHLKQLRRIQLMLNS
jgi:hypothetical protein